MTILYIVIVVIPWTNSTPTVFTREYKTAMEACATADGYPVYRLTIPDNGKPAYLTPGNCVGEGQVWNPGRV